jgi:hypothetical protein
MGSSLIITPSQIQEVLNNGLLTDEIIQILERCKFTIEELRGANDRLRRENEALLLDVHFLDISNKEK